MSSESPVITLKSKFGASLSFDTPVSFIAHIEQEQQAWSWLIDVKCDKHTERLWNAVKSPYVSTFEKLREYSHRAHRENAGDSLRNLVNDINSSLANRYTEHALLHSSDPEAIFVFELQNLDADEAIGALNYFMGLSLNNLSSAALPGILKAVDYRANLPARMHCEQTSFEKHRSHLDSQLVESVKKIEDHRRRIYELEKTIQDFIKSQEKKIDQSIEVETNKFEATIQRFRKEIPIASAVRYWEKKAKEHKGESRRYFWAFMSATVALGIVLTRVTLSFVGSGVKSDPSFWWEGLLHPFQSASILPIVVVGTLGGLLVRLFLKMYLSNVHLAEDAVLRVTMVKTYLALKDRGAPVEPSEMQVLLASLFHIPSSGIIKDDFGPISPADMLQRFVK